MKPLVGKSERHLNNSKDLVKKIQEIQLEYDEVLTSFDVSAWFTSVPGDDVVQMAVERATERLHMEGSYPGLNR